MSARENAYWVRDDRHSMILAGIVWALIVLMIVPEGFNYRIMLDTYAPASGGLLTRSLWLGLLAAAGAVIAWRASLSWLLLRSLNPFLLLFVALAAASVVWSIEPQFTVRRDIRLITIVAVCIAFCLTGWHARRFQNVVRPVLTIALLGSILFGLAAPALAIHQELSPELAGAWRGLTNHKNTFGALACTALILWLHGWLAGDVRRVRALLGCALAATCLWLSRSSTAAIAAATSVGILLLLMSSPRSLRPYLKFAVAIVAVALVVFALAILRLVPGLELLLTPVTSLTGVDLTFTGRSEIWAIIVERIRQNPLLGVGYGAYWTGPVAASPSYEFIWRMGSFYPGSAHNGYLDVANDLGSAGLVCLLGYVAVHVRQSLRVLAADKLQGALFVALFVQQATVNLSESHWFGVLSVQFVLMTLATTTLARLLLEQRLRARYGEPLKQVWSLQLQSPEAAASAAVSADLNRA
jgi:exopolysaccharide production protein ExoQ